jgi:hypothetical protein
MIMLKMNNAADISLEVTSELNKSKIHGACYNNMDYMEN